MLIESIDLFLCLWWMHYDSWSSLWLFIRSFIVCASAVCCPLTPVSRDRYLCT